MRILRRPTPPTAVEAVQASYIDGEIDLEQMESELEVALGGKWPRRFYDAMPAGLPPPDDTTQLSYG